MIDYPMRRVDVAYAALAEIGRTDLGACIVWWDDIGWVWLDDDDEADPDDRALVERAWAIADRSVDRLA